MFVIFELVQSSRGGTNPPVRRSHASVLSIQLLKAGARARELAEMNLELTRELLDAAEQQPHGQLRVDGREAAREVELLADAGFVEASVSGASDHPTAVIERLTETGRKLLNVLRENR